MLPSPTRKPRKPLDWEKHSELLRARKRLLRSGFTRELVRAVFAAQGGNCAVCGRPITEESAHADHEHARNVPRGLLCANCNLAEGHVHKTGMDAAEWGRRLAAYLADPPANSFRWMDT